MKKGGSKKDKEGKDAIEEAKSDKRTNLFLDADRIEKLKEFPTEWIADLENIKEVH
jgi:hypothetical protein